MKTPDKLNPMLPGFEPPRLCPDSPTGWHYEVPAYAEWPSYCAWCGLKDPDVIRPTRTVPRWFIAKRANPLGVSDADLSPGD